MAVHLTVRHENGKEEDLAMNAYPPEKPAEPQCREPADGVVLLAPGCLDNAEAVEAFVQDNRAVLDGCKRLVIDLRSCGRNGCEEALLPLLPYIAARETTAGELFGDRRIRSNYTKMNCARLAHMLRPYLTDADAGIARMAQETVAHYHAMSGRGWVEELDELCVPAETPVLCRGPREVVILTDTWCEDTAERLAQLAKRQGRAKLIGRPTMGTLDYCTPVSVQYDEFTFTYPISRTVASIEGHGTDEKGIAPDLLIPWTPEECRRDILMEIAIGEKARQIF